MKIGYVNAERRFNRTSCQCTGTYFTQNTLFGGALGRPKRIAELRGFLYDTKPENIDFGRVAEECNTLHQKYSIMPNIEWDV